MIIFNEYHYFLDILEKNDASKIGIKRLITDLAKYYYDECKHLSSKEYCEKVLQRMDQFNLPAKRYIEYNFANYALAQCSKMKSGKISHDFYVTSKIIITNPEMEIIHRASTEREQKLLFTLYVLSKNRDDPNGWVNYSLKDIFEYANISITNAEKYELLRKLYSDGFIDINHKVGKNGFKVMLVDGDPEIIIDQFHDFGRQYIISYKEGWTMCRNCGSLLKIKTKTGRPLQYCKSCASEIKNIQSKKSVYRIRNNIENVGKNSSPENVSTTRKTGNII